MAVAETVDVGHGRLGLRHLTSDLALVGEHDWSGPAQVFQRERHVTMKASRVQRTDVVYGVTNLRPEQAGPERDCRVWSISIGRSRTRSSGSVMSHARRMGSQCDAIAFLRSGS